MLGAEVRQRGSAGGGGALLLKRIGGRPPRPHARRPWRADPKPSAESRWWVGLVGWSPLFSPREQGRAWAPVCARCPRHPRHLSFPGGAALGGPRPLRLRSRGADRRAGSSNQPSPLPACVTPVRASVHAIMPAPPPPPAWPARRGGVSRLRVGARMGAQAV